MNIGILIDCAAVALGGLLGSLLKNRMPDSFKDQITKVLGLSSLGMGITSVVLMTHMPAVVFALILGTALGLAVKLGTQIQRAAVAMNSLIGTRSADAHQNELMVTAMVLFCASGTGIYGALTAGISGDPTILISKSILDLFTAMIFACTLGPSISVIAVPQFVILELLYLFAGVLMPVLTPEMIADFKACGGFIMMATGFRMTGILDFPLGDMLPGMVLVMPFSAIWSRLF